MKVEAHCSECHFGFNFTIPDEMEKRPNDPVEDFIMCQCPRCEAMLCSNGDNMFHIVSEADYKHMPPPILEAIKSLIEQRKKENQRRARKKKAQAKKYKFTVIGSDSTKAGSIVLLSDVEELEAFRPLIEDKKEIFASLILEVAMRTVKQQQQLN